MIAQFLKLVLKHNYIFWSVLQDRLLTRDRLQKLGMIIINISYSLLVGTDNINHLFFQCAFSQHLLQTICQELGLPTDGDQQELALLKIKGTRIRKKDQICNICSNSISCLERERERDAIESLGPKNNKNQAYLSDVKLNGNHLQSKDSTKTNK